MPTVKDVYAEAGSFLTQARTILDEYEGQEMPAEKQAEYDSLMDQFDAKSREAKRLERLVRAHDLINEPSNRLPTPLESGDLKRQEETDLQLKAYHRALKTGIRSLSDEERKSLRADDDDAGGFLVMPRQEVNQLLKNVDDLAPTRQLATIHRVEIAESLGVVTLESDPDDAEWTSELKTGDETGMDFGRRSLTPHPLAKRIKISNKLMRQVPNIEQLVRERLAYKFAVPQEKAFMTGDGQNQPLGVFTASPQGISTSRDVPAAAATAISGDDVINVKHALKPQYWARARWQLHRDILKALRKIKSSDNQYLWQPGLSSDLPSTLLEIPYILNEYAPNAVTSGQYTMIIGDWSFYWIADALDLQIQILRELYAETNQIGYIGRLESDGMPVLEQAFSRLKQA